MKTPLTTLLLAALLVAVPACRKNDASGEKVTPARKTSFEAVTSRLDPGGSVYGYLATDQWLAGLSTNMAQWGGLFLALPGTSDADRERMNGVLQAMSGAVARSGVEDLTGVGFSGIQVTPELWRTKCILHHNPGKGEGVFWNVLGRRAHALDGMRFLTEKTALASFGDVDLTLIWETIRQEAGAVGVPELTNMVAAWPQVFEERTKISWEQFLKSLGGEAGIVLTLDDSNRIQVPFTEGLQIPEPGLLVALKVNDTVLYDRISGEMQKSGMARMTDEQGLKMAAIRLPIPVPLDLELTVASAEGYLFVASSSVLVRNALAVRAGKEAGLRDREDIAELLKYLPKEGNHFFYADRRFSETIQSVQKAFLSKSNEAVAESEFFRRYLLDRKPTFGMVIGRRTDTGWESVAIGNQDSATALVAAPAAGGLAIVSAVAVPAFAKARAAAEESKAESLQE